MLKKILLISSLLLMSSSAFAASYSITGKVKGKFQRHYGQSVEYNLSMIDASGVTHLMIVYFNKDSINNSDLMSTKILDAEINSNIQLYLRCDSAPVYYSSLKIKNYEGCSVFGVWQGQLF